MKHYINEDDTLTCVEEIARLRTEVEREKMLHAGCKAAAEHFKGIIDKWNSGPTPEEMDPSGMTTAQVKAELIAYGADPEQVVARGKVFIAMCVENQKLRVALAAEVEKVRVCKTWIGRAAKMWRDSLAANPTSWPSHLDILALLNAEPDLSSSAPSGGEQDGECENPVGADDAHGPGPCGECPACLKSKTSGVEGRREEVDKVYYSDTEYGRKDRNDGHPI